MPASSAKVLSASSFCSMVARSQNESFTMPVSVGVATPANHPRLVSAFPVKSLAIVGNLAQFSAFIQAEENVLSAFAAYTAGAEHGFNSRYYQRRNVLSRYFRPWCSAWCASSSVL
jgi:hypothetical protein